MVYTSWRAGIIYALVFCGGIAAGRWAAPQFDGTLDHSAYHGVGYDSTENWWPFNNDVSDLLMVVLTLGLLRYSYVQASASRRSADAYVESERGRLVFDSARISERTSNLRFSFRNIGRSPITLDGFFTNIQHGTLRWKPARVEYDERANGPFTEHELPFLSLGMNDYFSSSGFTDRRQDMPSIEHNIPLNDLRDVVVVTFRVRYHTGIGHSYELNQTIALAALRNLPIRMPARLSSERRIDQG